MAAKLTVGVVALSLLALSGCKRPPLKEGDAFCLNQAFGATKFFVAKSVNYPWVEAKPNPDCIRKEAATLTFWINIESVGAYSPDCVCADKVKE